MAVFGERADLFVWLGGHVIPPEEDGRFQQRPSEAS